MYKEKTRRAKHTALGTTKHTALSGAASSHTCAGLSLEVYEDGFSIKDKKEDKNEAPCVPVVTTIWRLIVLRFRYMTGKRVSLGDVCPISKGSQLRIIALCP